jgi:hypothetical protein
MAVSTRMIRAIRIFEAGDWRLEAGGTTKTTPVPGSVSTPTDKHYYELILCISDPLGQHKGRHWHTEGAFNHAPPASSLQPPA